MKTLKERWADALSDLGWWTVIILLGVGIWASFADSKEITLIHENSGKTHVTGGIGPCYGWKDSGLGMRICYTNRERTMCKTLIYNHDTWHEGEPYVCEENNKVPDKFEITK